jgi:hypothetical protein
MYRIVASAELVSVIEPHSRRIRSGRTPLVIAMMLSMFLKQLWLGPSDPEMEEPLGVCLRSLRKLTVFLPTYSFSSYDQPTSRLKELTRR